MVVVSLLLVATAARVVTCTAVAVVGSVAQAGFLATLLVAHTLGVPDENALFALDLGERIDATPVAFGNYVVVATTGSTEQTRLFCFKLS